MKKIFTVALLRDLEKQVMKGDISYSKMVEILNEKAWEGYEGEKAPFLDLETGEFNIGDDSANIRNVDGVPVLYFERQLVFQSEKYKKLFAVQTHPETKYFFRDKEVSLEELTALLDGL